MAAATFSCHLAARQLTVKSRVIFFNFCPRAPSQSPPVLLCPRTLLAVLVTRPSPLAPAESRCGDVRASRRWALGGNYRRGAAQREPSTDKLRGNAGAAQHRCHLNKKLHRRTARASELPLYKQQAPEILSLNTEFQMQITIAICWKQTCVALARRCGHRC